MTMRTVERIEGAQMYGRGVECNSRRCMASGGGGEIVASLRAMVGSWDVRFTRKVWMTQRGCCRRSIN
jgi:hypothetical protein